MILTGKAKEDFYKYLNIKDYKLFDYVRKKYANEIVSNALIIEWFDSVGIYISINYVDFYDELRNDKGFEACVTNKGLSVMFRSVSSRQEATLQAIKKANEIYNSKI